MSELHYVSTTLATAAIFAFCVLSSGIGIGCITGHFTGTNTVKGRGRAMLAGLLGGLFTMNVLFWLVFNGYKVFM